MADGERKWALAFLLACPACVGGFLIPVVTALGVSAWAFRSIVLVAVLLTVVGLWAVNYWRRRHEEACHVATLQPGADSR